MCGGNCVNTNTDANHCGKCNNACPTTNKCEGGQCTANPSCSKDSECLNFQVCLANKCTEPWCKNGLVNCGTLEGCCTYAINALQNGYQFWSEVCVAQPQFYKCSDPIVGLPAIKAVCTELGCEEGTQGKIKGNCGGADAQKNFEKARGWIENAFQALDGFCKLYSHNNCGPRKQEVSDYFFKQLCQCSPRGC
ncbi:hypothetical protein L6R29_11615 [Myxococcota bacterium]|nr:hypothetical protein [Myxococcota bacterium]